MVLQAQGRWILVFTIAAVLAVSRPAWAELTVESLTGTAVSGIGAYIQDVTDAISKFQNRDYAGAFANLEGEEVDAPAGPARSDDGPALFRRQSAAGGHRHAGTSHSAHPQDPEMYIMLAERAVNERRITERIFCFKKRSNWWNCLPRIQTQAESSASRLHGRGGVDEGRSDWTEARAKLDALIKLDSKMPRHTSDWAE